LKFSLWGLTGLGGLIGLLKAWELIRKKRAGESDQAMSQTPEQGPDKDAAMTAANGGIDLNRIAINPTGRVVNIQFDPAQLNQLIQRGFEGFTPVIINMTRISSPFQLLGIGPTIKSSGR
jgi:hypothetical protein